MTNQCNWLNNDAVRHVHNKKAVGACLFISFLAYTFAAVFSEAQRGKKISVNLKRFVNDVASSQLFFFLCAMCVHVLHPNVFPVILLYLYLITQLAQCVAYCIENRVLSQVVQALQIIITFILLIAIMADDWCDFYLYRNYT